MTKCAEMPITGAQALKYYHSKQTGIRYRSADTLMSRLITDSRKGRTFARYRVNGKQRIRYTTTQWVDDYIAWRESNPIMRGGARTTTSQTASKFFNAPVSEASAELNRAWRKQIAKGVPQSTVKPKPIDSFETRINTVTGKPYRFISMKSNSES